MMTHHDYDGPDYQCHYCNNPITEDHMIYSTEYAGRDIYFCSKSCMYEWDTVDDVEEYYDRED